jgi:uncharacterized membrane protein
VPFVAWNLFLAALPVGLAHVLVAALTRHDGVRRLPTLGCLVLAGAWLAFLPNTCYLITEWRHLVTQPFFADVLQAARTDRSAMLLATASAAFFLLYSGVGILAFVLAIRPVARFLRSRGRRFSRYAPVLFFLLSVGVYLGLVVRLNSWDLVVRPLAVLEAAIDAFARPLTLALLVAFGAFLGGLFLAVDLWVDALVERHVLRPRRTAAEPAEARAGSSDGA